MSKVKIAILTSSDFPYRGAPESFVRQMANGMHLNDAEIEVILFWGNRYSNTNDTPIKCSNYLFKVPFKNEFLKFIELACQIIYSLFFVANRRLLKKDQGLILYGLDRAYIVFPLILWSKIFKLKCYRIITEIYPSYTYATHWWRKPNIIFNILQLKYFDRYLNGMIVLSKYLYDICIKNGVSDDRILLIPNFINLEINNPNSNDNLNYRIGFCGYPSSENGIIDLLKAFLLLRAEISNIEIIVMGEIPNVENIKIKENNLNCPNVIFTGWLTKIEVEKELLKCNVLVNPRKTGILADSGFPTKLGEYFATKIPVVTTKVGELSNYFSDKNELVFADPDNPESLAEAILFLYSNQEKAQEIGINGYMWANENLDYIKNSRKVLNFIIKS